jgi:hypothetical protein
MFKNIAVFYVYLFFPISTMVLLSKLNLISSDIFMYGILFYSLFYHSLISGIRLLQLKVCSINDVWRTFIPFWNLKYFDILFFGAKRIS